MWGVDAEADWEQSDLGAGSQGARAEVGLEESSDADAGAGSELP